MIDGVKIELLNHDYKKWLSNDLLDFEAITSIRTRKMLGRSILAKYQGLIFEIKQNKEDENKYDCFIRGSLHKYWNKGKINNNDFTIIDLNKCIIQLSNAFGFESINTVLHGLEAGVNIKTPITAKEVLKSLVSDGINEFYTFSENGKPLGKSIGKQRYKLKIYNKGKQSGTRINNLLRVELSINKMEHLKGYNITTLADLQNPNKVNKLIALLLKQWDKIIYWDKKTNSRLLTQFEQTKYQSYGNYRNWTDYNKTQRTRARKQYSKLLDKAGTQQDFKTLRGLIVAKWEQLGQYNHETKPNTPPPVKKECKNPNCTNSINHKKSIAKYCSKQCNNVVNGLKRTKQRQHINQKENDVLKRVINQIPKNVLTMSVYYSESEKSKACDFSDYLHQSEICPEKDFIKRIQKIDFDPIRKNGKQLKITGTRAKRFIRILRIYNLSS